MLAIGHGGRRAGLPVHGWASACRARGSDRGRRVVLRVGVLVILGMLAVVPGAQGSVGVVGSFGSPLPSAGAGQFDNPRGVAVNTRTGDVYVADSANNRIEEFTAAGVFIRKAGGMSDPQGVAVDQSTGDVYVSDEGNLRVDELSENGGFIRAWGAGVVASGPDKIAVNAQQSVTITASGGTFTLGFASESTVPIGYRAPAQGEAVKGEVSVQKALESLSSVGAGNVSVSGPAGGPYTITFTGALADMNVERMTANGTGLTGTGAGVSVLTRTVGDGAAEVCTTADTCKAGVSAAVGGAFASTFDGYVAVVPAGAPDAGDVIVADPGNSRVQEFTATGEFVRAYGREVNQSISEEAGSTMTERDLCTAVSGDLCQAGAPGGEVGQFAAGAPTGVAVDSTGAIYTVEPAGGFRVQKLTPADGGLSPAVFAGSTLTGGEAADAPTDVAVDPTTNDVYVIKVYPEGTGEPRAVVPERRVLRLSPSGTLQETGMVDEGIDSVLGLALNPANGRLYVSSLTSGQRVYVLEDVAPVAGCPNEALREESDINPSTGHPLSTELPDCRAYEQVTPSYTDGFKITDIAEVSEDGSRVIGHSLGTFVGIEDDLGSVEGGVYRFSRTASGWTTTGLNPPASLFPEQEYGNGIMLPDGSTIWKLRPVSESLQRQRDIMVQAPDGVLTDVGPMLPPTAPARGSIANVVAASQDASHIFFSAGTSANAEEDERWPFDESDQSNKLSDLYEYTGTQNTEPELVGVSGGRGSHTLISQCGIELGSGHKVAFDQEPVDNAYNAVSASGETVFFTAEHQEGACPKVLPPPAPVPQPDREPSVSEVYARVSGEKTVSVSEPILPAGEACTGVCAEYDNETGGHHRSEGIFDGASEDGSKVFFETEQPLLNGDKDTKNDLYMAVIEGDGQNAAVSKLVLVSHDPTPGQASEVLGVARVSEDGSRVYFVAKGILTSEANGLGQTATLGGDNLYVYDTDTGQTAFVATLATNDSADWGTEIVRPVQATPDGGFLVFWSRANITGDAPGEHMQLYRYDAATGGLLRVSIGQDGFNDDGATGNIEVPPAGGRVISDDGSYVFFQSSDGLTPRALNEVTIDNEGHKARNVYEWEADGAGACRLLTGCVSLITDGHDISEAEGSVLASLAGTDASGKDVFFFTSDELSPSDTNSTVSIYDARVDGGFPAPVEPVSCVGEGCQPESSSSVPDPPADSSFGDPGGLVAPLATVTSVVSPGKTAPQSKTAAQVRALKLAGALRVCRSKARSRRRGCEALARKRYGSQAKAKGSIRRAGR